MSLIFPSPFGQKESSVLIGHDAAINSVRWSNSGLHVLTASSDKTAVVWDRATGEGILTLNQLAGNCGGSGGGGGKVGGGSSGGKVGGGSGGGAKSESSHKKSAFSKEVRGAQFFYMDQFMLVAVGNQLCLYKFHLDPTKDDIRRYLTKSRYKLVKSWETCSQNFTALAAPNTFYSHLAVCAGSNRDLEIYDLNEGRLGHVFTDAHGKPVHTIALNEGSSFSSQPQSALNVFATSSVLDCVRLWDTRTRRCVLTLQGHANNAHGCGIAFSACGTYLASGSEDKVVYVYDIRQGTFCERLRGHRDVVSSVAFHPASPVLATGAINGKVLLFKSS
jgi:WD40 repeat protein